MKIAKINKKTKIYNEKGYPFASIDEDGNIEIYSEVDFKNKVCKQGRYNVLDYGVTATNSDNTDIINLLIEDISKRGGGEIYFPAGVYKFKGTIYLKNNITLNGAGWESVLLQEGTGSLIQISDSSYPWTYNIMVSNLFLNCNNNNNSGSGILIYGTYSNGLYTTGKIIFDSLRIENFGYAGINVEWTLIDVFYHRLWVTNNGRFGIKVSVDCDVINCFIGENGRKYPNDFYNCGILVAGADTRISNCHIWGWGQEKGILIEWSGDIQVLGCVIEEHSKEGIYIKNSSTTRVIGNYLEDNSFGNNGVYSAIKIVGDNADNPSVHTFIIGNRFGKQIWGGFQAGHKYCVEEEGAYVDYTTFQSNYVYKGYTNQMVKFIGNNSREIDNVDEVEKGFNLYNNPNLNSLFRFRQRPSTRASEANFIIKSYPGRAGLQVVRDMRNNPYRGHAFEFATIYDDPYPTGGQTATGLRFMVGHSVDDDTADVYPLVRLYAVRNDPQYRSELTEGVGILLFQLNTTGQTDWDGGHIATKFVMYPTGWLGVNTDRPVTHLDVNGDFALKHVKVMYYSSSKYRLEIGDVSGSGSPQMIRLKGVTEIGQMFKLSNSSFSDFTGISYTSHTHGTDVLNGIGIYGNDSTLRILLPTQVNMQSPHPNSILFIQGDNDGANRIFRDNDTGFIAIVGGWSSTRNASISLFGNDNTSFYGGINLVLGANPNSALRVYKADGNGGFSELMRVTSDGKVGIGGSPTCKLRVVSGNGLTRETQIGLGRFYDYEQYPLYELQTADNDPNFGEDVFFIYTRRWMSRVYFVRGSSSGDRAYIKIYNAETDTRLFLFDATALTGGDAKIMLSTTVQSYFDAGNVGIKIRNPETALDVAGTIQARRLQDATSSNQFINSNLIQLQGAYWNGSQSVNVAWKLRTTVESTISNRLDILNNSNEAIGIFRNDGFYTKKIFSWNEKVNKYLGVITNWTDLSGRTIEDGDLVVFYDSVLNTYSLYIYVNQTVGWKLVNALT